MIAWRDTCSEYLNTKTFLLATHLLCSSVSCSNISSQISPRQPITKHRTLWQQQQQQQSWLFPRKTHSHISSQWAPGRPLLTFNIQSPTCELCSFHTAHRWSHTILISVCVERRSDAMWLVWPPRDCARNVHRGVQSWDISSMNCIYCSRKAALHYSFISTDVSWISSLADE